MPKSLVGEMRKKTEAGKLRNKKLDEDYEHREARRFVELDKKAAEAARNLFKDCIAEIKKAANLGKSNVSFTATEFTNPNNDEKYTGMATAQHLARLIEKKGFCASPDCSISEGDCDDSRNFYWYNVEISWEK